jgi:hypothetical protein
MAITSKALTNLTADSIFTSAGTQGDAVTTMYFCNRANDTRTFNLYLVPNGDVAGANNIAYSNKIITAGDTYIIDWEKLVLSPGDTIQANSNVGNSIVATVSTIGV